MRTNQQQQPSIGDNSVDEYDVLLTDYQRRLVDKNRNKPTLNTVAKLNQRISSQQRLLHAANNSSLELAKVMRSEIGIGDSFISLPRLKVAPLGGELKYPNVNWEVALRDSLNVTRRTAAKPVFWFLCHIHWLENESLPDPPAHALNVRSISRDWLESDPAALDDQSRLSIDNATRDLLRNTSGIAHVRDARAFVYDCPAAAAWWRVEVANIAAGATGEIDRDGILAILCHRPRWSEIVSKTMRSFGVLSAPEGIAAIAIACKRYCDSTGSYPDRLESRTFLQNLARRTAGLSIAAFRPEHLADLCFE